MFSLPSSQISELCRFAYISDKETRSDLSGGYISSENDYTSNFTGALRRIINANSQTGLVATSYLLQPPEERLMGCDATIIITCNGYYKIATFEAKYPRLSQTYYSWDYEQTSSGISHFSDQLERQKSFAGQHAIFEMFYCEIPFGKQPSYMQKETSSCVWHENAVMFDNSRTSPQKVWERSDLENLLKKGNESIATIMKAICECSKGKPNQSFGSIPTIAKEFSLFGNVLHIASNEQKTDTIDSK
ncbi:hypothetical protein [Shewanella polaris]|uniref:Uncharacterized protein n=1 Tax=Shewanella polaris TaxID=2588449 RepID=A0A4Y5YDW0_9GAMM|nr:hypothetical protein [Shewanella polaris]QDE30942.1 hypothetical protein FH971_08165 [Shewanella polaris]